MGNNYFKDKDILVTGGAGSIGTEIVKQLIQFKLKRLRVFDNSESALFRINQRLHSKNLRFLVGDIKDYPRVLRAMNKVDIVFHVAALKHVPFCEYNPFEAVKTNVLGTKNVIEAAINNGVKKVVAISTDKAVNPINTMGATKLLAEKLILSAPVGFSHTIFSCVRFGNVMDSDGSVIPIFREQIRAGGPVTITSEEMTRFFMSKKDAVKLVLKAAEIMKGSEIFILKMKALRIVDLAKAMIEELAPKAGYKPEKIEFKTIGIRPGEKLHEKLMTREEWRNAKDIGDMYIIQKDYTNDRPLKKSLSSNNRRFLSIDEIKSLLRTEGII